jgi:lysophospholipase L1-like esterase
VDYPRIFWVLIGTNDLGSGCRPEVVLVGILRIIEELLLRQPTSTIFIHGILPRSTFSENGYLLYNGSYWRAIEAINEQLEAYSKQRSRRVHYFDARDLFLVQPNASQGEDESVWQIDKKLMPDFLHPSSTGYQRWGEVIVERIESL